MSFDEYLREKKIDPEKFKVEKPDQYQEFLEIFGQIHPNSFTQQKLFLINQIRRNFLLKDQKEPAKPAAPKAMKPKIKPLKPKTS